ncbi:MHO_1580 family protein [[Mycoplasma] collis]|uniref:MHO_1580 family protein n=1 Tax=[Mycoplasma] collis TaxID=2127 RepID=UPI00051BBCAC|nr:hypothetical protein [[Mycoplasma] collis]
MVNVPIVVNNQELQSEKNIVFSDSDFKKEIIFKFDNFNSHKNFIEIKRYLKSDAFSIKITHFTKLEKFIKINIYINDQLIEYKVINKIPNDGYGVFVFPFSHLKKEFSEIKNIKIIASEVELDDKNQEISDNIVIQTNLTKIKNFNKIVEFDAHKPIEFKTVKVIRIESNNKLSEYYESEYEKKYYNNIYFFPRKLINGLHNEVLFDVATNNDIYPNEIFDKDFDLKAFNLTDIPIENNEKLKLNFEKVSNYNNNLVINGKKIIGQIKIVDFTYYDILKQKTINENNIYSKNGFLIPYNFQGLLKLKSEIFLNNEFKNIFLNYSQKIEKPFLDKNNGIVKLHLTSYKNKELNEIDHYLLENKKLDFILNDNIDINGLKTLYKKEEFEENSDDNE